MSKRSRRRRVNLHTRHTEAPQLPVQKPSLLKRFNAILSGVVAQFRHTFIKDQKTFWSGLLALVHPKTYIRWLQRRVQGVGKNFYEFRTDRKAWMRQTNKRLRIVGVPLIVLALLFWFFILRDLPAPTKLGRYDIPLSTKIYDRNGELLYEVFSDENRTLVTLDQIPEDLKNATVAIEDKEFYHHGGVNPIGGILRAAKSSIEKQRLEGGSTITQQLIKSALLTPERTIQRKVKEIILATWAEFIYSKDEILEMYLNQVPYGGTAWGIHAASDKYFDKKPSELTLAESALLAGLPQSPTSYSPFGAYPELAIARQHAVLRRMAEDGYITNEEAEAAKLEDLKYASPSATLKAPHFVLYVKDLLVKKYGEKEVEQGGFSVTTTLDYGIQEAQQLSQAMTGASTPAPVSPVEPTVPDQTPLSSVPHFNETTGASAVAPEPPVNSSPTQMQPA